MMKAKNLTEDHVCNVYICMQEFKSTKTDIYIIDEQPKGYSCPFSGLYRGGEGEET